MIKLQHTIKKGRNPLLDLSHLADLTAMCIVKNYMPVMAQLFLQQAVLASLGEEDIAKTDAALNKLRAARDLVERNALLNGAYLFRQSQSSKTRFCETCMNYSC